MTEEQPSAENVEEKEETPSTKEVAESTTQPSVTEEEEQPTTEEVEDAPLTKEVAENSIQDAVDKVQTSKTGQVPLLDAMPPENGRDSLHAREGITCSLAIYRGPANLVSTGILPEVPRKESSALPTCPPDFPLPDTKVEKDKTEPAVATEVVAASTTTTDLPERPKEQETAVVGEKVAAADVPSFATHPKRPYETSLFAKEEAKPPKIPKVDEPAPAQPREKAQPATEDTAKAEDLETPKSEPAGAAAVAPVTTPDVTAKETKDDLPAEKETKLPSVEAASPETAEKVVHPVETVNEPTPAAEAEALEKESDVAEVSGVASGFTAPSETTNEALSAQATATAAETAVGTAEQPQTTVTTGFHESLEPAPVTAPNSVAGSRDNSVDASAATGRSKDGASSSSTDTLDSESKLKEEELRKAEARVEAHKDAIRHLMTDETNPEVAREETKEEAKEEGKKELKHEKPSTRKDVAGKEEKQQEQKAAEETSQKKPEEPATGRTSIEKKTSAEKSADKAKEAAAAAKEEAKKGGFWSWLKRKVRG